MSVLYFRDKNGKFIQVTGIHGKSAYEIAVEKGVFNGTEQEFAEMQVIHNKDIIDQITQENINTWNNIENSVYEQLGMLNPGMTDEERRQLEDNTNNILKIVEMIDGLPMYSRPIINLTLSETIIEHNTTKTIILTPKFEQNDAGNFENYILKKGDKVIYEGLLKPYGDTIALSHGGTITYTGIISYKDGEIKNTNLGIPYLNDSIKAGSISVTKSVKAYAPSYYGAINTNSIDNISDLTKIIVSSKNNTFTFNSLTKQYIVYMYPKSFGVLTSIKDGNNFNYISSYTLTTMVYNNVEYNVYILTDAVTISNFKQIFN